ncbi:8996_t:CDS:2 [Cetraspora pellucida]|uniref:8996_t:CDS:1 n=1 Tax=Cetraspora pellucida TaxID=1433469 RepID=A0ACA9LHJ8_9GLOM|nr:8996_t:CDS:2 [Cetraspora pellucida]
MSETEGEFEEEPQEETTEINEAAMVVGDLSPATNLAVQELEDNIKEYIHMISQPTATEDLLTDEALEKVIRYQESLDVGHGFDENELKTLRKKLREWRYEKEKNKKQSSLLFFFNRTDAAL